MKSPSCGPKTFPLLRAPVTLVAIAVALVCACAPSSTSASAGALVVRYPGEDAHIGAVASSFAIGAAPPGSTVTVNGVPALIAPDGGWSAFVPFTAGRFLLHVHAVNGAWSASIDRPIDVDNGAVAAFPTDTTIVQPGESVQLTVSAPAGSTVTASGPGFSGIALSPHTDVAPGAFAASTAMDHPANKAVVVYRIVGADGRVADVASRGTLEIATHPVLFVGVVVPYAPDPEAGFRPYAMLAPTLVADTAFTEPPGTRLAVTGRFGDQFRVMLPGAPAEFVDTAALARELHPTPMAQTDHLAGVRVSPPGTALLCAPSLPPSLVAATVTIPVGDADPPFRVIEEAGATGRIEVYGAPDKPDGITTIAFALHQRAFYGYRARWTPQGLVVQFRKPPPFGVAPRAALSGLTIVVDPGHSPDTGAIGPIGTLERDVNLDISMRLAARLRALGAKVVMTRTTSAPVLLYARPALAERIGADILISIHNNAPPDGIDPAKMHGYSVYYFQPHSLALARSIHDAYREQIGIPDAGLHSGDLALVRTSEMPAVLTESAFITWPWEEIRLRDPSFRQRLALTIADGMEHWAEQMRALEGD